MTKTNVANKHHKVPYDVYIGRGSKWGNPFSHMEGTTAKYKVKSREEAVEKYREWILTQPQLLSSLHELKGKTLCCYCKPKSCHGDILAELADKYKSKSACFTGHRPNKLNGYNPKDNKEMLFKLREIIVDHIENKNVDTFITGMALGIDMWAARVVFKLKETYPHIKVIAAVPCDKQYNKWPEKSQNEWKAIIQRCDEVSYVSDEPYTHWCMQKRNEWMVDNSHYVIAVWDGTKGGTGNCVNYAIKEGKEIVQLHPKTLVIN